MATLVLAPLFSSALAGLFATGSVGALVGSSVGLALGAGIGGFIDNFAFSFLTPKPEGIGKLDDLRVTSGSEGAPINFITGRRARVEGNVIWAQDLIEDEDGGGGCFGDEPTTYEYFANFAVLLCDHEIEAVEKIWANGKLIYDGGLLVDARYTDVTIYLGTDVQTPDPLMEADLGAGEVPAYRGKAYIVFELLALADFGNQIPNITVLVRRSATATLSDAIQEIWDRMDLSGLITLSDPDVSALSALDIVTGYQIRGPASTISSLEPLVVAYALSVRDTEGVLEFLPRKSFAAIGITSADLGMAEFDAEAPKPLVFSDNAGRKLPDEVNVIFQEPDGDYQTGSQSARRGISITRVVTTIQMPMVLTAGQAKAIAERTLYSAWSERMNVEFQLGPAYVGLQEGDLVQVQQGTDVFNVRLSEVNIGYNLLVNCKGVVETANTLENANGGTSSPTPNPQTPITPLTDITMHLMDLPPLANEHMTQPGFYFAMVATEPDEVWRGAALYISYDGGLTFERLGQLLTESVAGEATTALGAWDENTKDTTNTVRVELINGTLSTLSTAEVNTGKNWALLGDEIIAFETATLISPGVYDLTNLYRGRRDTVDTAEMGTHNTGDRFVLLDKSKISFARLDLDAIGDTVTLRAVPKYGTVASMPDVSFTPAGETLKNFRPRNIVRNDTYPGAGANDIVIEWDRKSRAWSRIDGTSNPLDEALEEYELEIYNWNGDIGTLRREAAVTGEARFTYNTLMQAADGHTAGHPVYVKVWQIGSFLGRGNQGGGATTEYPGNIAGVRLHLIADDIDQADGSNVATWNDSSGAGNHCTAGATNPVLQTNEINGHAVVRFAGGAAEYLTSTLNTAFTDFTAIVVHKASAPGTNFRRLLDKDYINGFYMGHSGADATGNQWGGGVKYNLSPNGDFVLSTHAGPRVLMMRRVGTSVRIKSDQTDTTFTQASATGALDTTALRIGNSNFPSSTDGYIGDIAEVLVFNRALTNVEIYNIFEFLKDKYGI